MASVPSSRVTAALAQQLWVCPTPKPESSALLCPPTLSGAQQSCLPWTQMNIQFALSQSRAECFPAAEIVLLDSKPPENLSVGCQKSSC